MHTIPAIILKSYSTVQLDKVKMMLGAKQMPAAEFKKLIDGTNLLESDKPDSKGFVNVSNIELVQDTFTLDMERVVNLGQIV